MKRAVWFCLALVCALFMSSCVYTKYDITAAYQRGYDEAIEKHGTYEKGYEDGYKNGKSEGYSEGTQEGEERGYYSGYEEGFRVGYGEALRDYEIEW